MIYAKFGPQKIQKLSKFSTKESLSFSLIFLSISKTRHQQEFEFLA